MTVGDFELFSGFQEGIRVHDRFTVYFDNSGFRTLMNIQDEMIIFLTKLL
uniref:Uncharacterized protein n=1 Tax=Chlorobium phaeobacteroides (strain BS1) TaxID=331678 RepID=B3EJM5_CHLPB